MAIVLISGTAGSVKKQVRQKLEFNHGYERIVSMTTRSPYLNETNKDYTFTDESSFERLARNGALLEHVEHCGNRFGVAIAEVAKYADSDKNSVLIMTPEGVERAVRYLKANNIDYVAIYVSEPIRRVVTNLANRRDLNSLSMDDFIEKMTSIAKHETKWRGKALSGTCFDLFFEAHGKAGDVESIVHGVHCHILRLNKVRERKKMMNAA